MSYQQYLATTWWSHLQNQNNRPHRQGCNGHSALVQNDPYKILWINVVWHNWKELYHCITFPLRKILNMCIYTQCHVVWLWERPLFRKINDNSVFGTKSHKYTLITCYAYRRVYVHYTCMYTLAVDSSVNLESLFQTVEISHLPNWNRDLRQWRVEGLIAIDFWVWVGHVF